MLRRCAGSAYRVSHPATRFDDMLFHCGRLLRRSRHTLRHASRPLSLLATGQGGMCHSHRIAGEVLDNEFMMQAKSGTPVLTLSAPLRHSCIAHLNSSLLLYISSMPHLDSRHSLIKHQAVQFIVDTTHSVCAWCLEDLRLGYWMFAPC